MIKKLSLPFLLLCVFALVGCDKEMAPLTADYFTVNPSPLEAKGGLVNATVTGTFPEKYFNKNAVVTVTPYMVYAEGETAQAAENLDKWTATKSKMHSIARQNFDDCAANINPKFLADPFLQTFVLNEQEEESIAMQKTNVNAWVSQYNKDFVCGTNSQDINNDAHWKKFIDGLYEQGYEDVQKMYQTCYERQK